MAEIPLINRSGDTVGYALVDDEDAAWIGQWTWRASRDKGGSYAVRSVGKRGIRMHRVIMGLDADDPLEVDHRNLNRIDNRRANLRVGTHALNKQNARSLGGTSRFRGVSLHGKTGRWRATVQLADRQHDCGLYTFELDAARAAEAFRRKHMPFALPDPALAAVLS